MTDPVTDPATGPVTEPAAAPSGAPMHWRALHCFLSDTSRLERFLLDAVVPEMDRLLAGQLLQRWFYIRYDEGGHHLRLRLSDLTEPEYGALAQRLAGALAAFKPAPVEAPAEGDAPAPHPWLRSRHGEASVIGFPYDPEVQRYGGAHALPVSEKLFFISSRLSAEMLRKAGAAMPTRLAIAADLMTACVAAQGLDHARAIVFFMSYATYWEQFLTRRQVGGLDQPDAGPTRYEERHAAFVEDLARPGTAPRSLATVWARALHEAVLVYRGLGSSGLLVSPTTGEVPRTAEAIAEAITSVMASQVHMMNNRLGVAPTLEYKLSRILAASAIAAANRQGDGAAAA